MKYMLNCLWALVILAALATVSGAPQRGQLVAEGHLVAGHEGRVIYDPNERQWAFVPNEPITDGKGTLPAEEKTALLSCSVLEQMIRLAGEQKAMDVRLWAMTTEYRGRNYLFSLYFLPMRETAPEPSKPDPSQSGQAEEPQKESILPSEILEMMQRNRAPDLRRLDELVVVSTDRNLIHRTGMIERSGEDFVFRPDAFGQNVAEASYRLLPCRTLEATQRTLQRTPDRGRYVVSGVVTEFEGQTYLLPRRAVRTYTHGNFTP